MFFQMLVLSYNEQMLIFVQISDENSRFFVEKLRFHQISEFKMMFE